MSVKEMNTRRIGRVTVGDEGKVLVRFGST